MPAVVLRQADAPVPCGPVVDGERLADEVVAVSGDHGGRLSKAPRLPEKLRHLHTEVLAVVAVLRQPSK